MLKFLGTLPASDSPFMKLNGLDIVKTLRVAVVTFCGVFLYAFGQSIFGHCDPAVTGYCDLSSVAGTLQTIFSDGMQSGVAAVSASAFEIVRRLLIAN